jgi:hemin uptake protein HemP
MMPCGRRHGRQRCIDVPIAAKASEKPAAAPTGAPPLMPKAPICAVSSRDLLAGRRVLVIRHGPEGSRLQITRNGKLILTK